MRVGRRSRLIVFSMCTIIPLNILKSPEFLRSFSISARPKSASSSSSDVSKHDRPGRREGQDATLRDYNGNDNSGSSTPRSRDAGDPAFDVITQQTTNHQSGTRDDGDSFFVRNHRFCQYLFFSSDSASNTADKSLQIAIFTYIGWPTTDEE